MRPRYGPLYTRAVLRPLAEQLAELVQLSEVRTACDVLCDSGAATTLLVKEPQIEKVWCADTESEIAVAAAGGSRALALHMTDGRIPLPDEACDLVVSLFTLGFAPSLRSEASRILTPHGRLVTLTWDSSDPPLHERALAIAVEEVTGVLPDFMQRVLWSDGPDGRQMRDVVRFDSADMCWTAVFEERPLSDDIPASRADEIRRRFVSILEHVAEADSTLRIPVTCHISNQAGLRSVS